jgi:hypothetical protein
MSLLSDAFAMTKKVLLLSENLDRLTEESRQLSRSVIDHEHRLIRIETLIEVSGAKRTRHRLPGE